MSSEVDKFRTRLMEEWLPVFCNDPKRGYGADGFRESSIKVTEADARDCLYAIDQGLVKDFGGGRYKAPRSNALEQLFWQGRRDSRPRLVTLWLEPVITFAVLARLHRDHHWPAELLGTQPKTWAFDLVAHAPKCFERSHILCEVKKSNGEADRLLKDLLALRNGLDSVLVSENSRRKWRGLLIDQPPVLLICAPSARYSVYRLAYPSPDTVLFQEADCLALDFDAAL